MRLDIKDPHKAAGLLVFDELVYQSSFNALGNNEVKNEQAGKYQ